MGTTFAKEFYAKGENIAKINPNIDHIGSEDINHGDFLRNHFSKVGLKQ